MHLAHHPTAVALLRRGRAGGQCAGRTKHAVVHAQRHEDVVPSELSQRHLRKMCYQFAEHDVIHVAVSETCSRLGSGNKLIDALQRLGSPVLIIGHGVVCQQSAGVQQELLDGDVR